MIKTAKYHIYCDASFSREDKIGVAGFLLFENLNDNGSVGTTEIIKMNVFKEENNIRAELRSAIFSLETLSLRLNQTNINEPAKQYKINLYTDCLSIVQLLNRRDRLESLNFTSKKTGYRLTNADLYEVFFEVYDKLYPKIFWVKGHMSIGNRDAIHQNFSRLDKAVRKELRFLTSKP